MLDMDQEQKSLTISRHSDLSQYLNDEFFSDLTLLVNGHPVYVQKSVLAANSSNFRGMFSYDFKEARKSETKLQDVSDYETLLEVMKFCYNVKPTLTPENAMEIFRLADYYNIHELMTHVGSYLK